MHTAVAQLLESSAYRSATKLALITRERTLTFAELNNLPTCFSAGLAAMAFRQVIAQLCAKEMVGGGSWLTMESSALVRRRSRPLAPHHQSWREVSGQIRLLGQRQPAPNKSKCILRSSVLGLVDRRDGTIDSPR